MHPFVRRALGIAVVAASLVASSATPVGAAPSVAVTQAPPATTSATSATISFHVSSFRPASITCALDGARARPCRSPVSYTRLRTGAHSLRIVAQRGRLAASTVVRWTVAAAPAPTVAITDGPPEETESMVVAPPQPGAVSPAAPAVPRSPSAYTVPSGAVRVASAAELEAVLATSPARDIVLADGRYETAGWFSNHEGHRLYAERLGGAVLASGLEIGANWGSGGAVVQGLTFDVSSLAQAVHGALVHVWGPAGASTRVLDCVFRGNGAIAFGLLAYNPSGLVAKRLVFSSFTDVALRASDNQAVPYGAATPRIASIADVSVDGVGRPTPGASDGTAEAGLWIGHPVTAGVHRIAVRNVSWSGIETVNNAWDTTFTDLDIDMSGPKSAAAVGIYLEHFNHRNVFERFRIAGAATGITAEWADPAWGGVAGAHEIVIRDGVIDAAGAREGKTFGVYLDEGTVSTTVTGVVFRNQSFAAIGAYKIAGTNRFEGNDTSGLRASALPLSTEHWSSPAP